MQLIIPRVLDQATFDQLVCLFENEDELDLILPQHYSTDELFESVAFLLRQNPNNLRNLLMADLVEFVNFPAELLEEVFKKGDISCRVAISLRSDLPPKIEELCAMSPDQYVRDHYFYRLNKQNQGGPSDS